ncbi:hypothetical protein [Modestobacter sp. Leaf380]|uniref:hypothetical protein n=1 Tax=Modestobacter sp. Leaf380 TaxID=1736356 RepID=UPI0012FA6052|nr:hypothetical protein [Modestobacter sp. Leaf380]
MTTPVIDPQDVLRGAQLKLVRARVLVSSLLEEIDRVLTTPTQGSATPNPDGTFSAYYRPAAEPTPVMSLVLGEFAHNARSALDNVVTSLVVSSGGTPKSNHKFPVFKTETAWRGKVATPWPGAGPLAGLSQEDFDLIEAVQPFHADEPDRHPLALLAQINNADKHQMLHAAMAYTAQDADQRVLEVVPPLPVEIVWTPPRGTLLAAGAEATRYRFTDSSPSSFGLKLNWPLSLLFRDHLGRDVYFFELNDIYVAAALAVRPWLDPPR